MQFPKWLDQIEPQHSVAEAAALSLRQRLSAVSYYLPLAAKRPDETSEHVHQLRVGCRRSLAAVVLYRPVLGDESVAWFEKWLRQIRKAAGEARDLDVLLERYDKQFRKASYKKLRNRLRRCRSAAQQPLVKLNRRLGKSGRLDRRIEELVQSIDVTARDNFHIWAEQQLNVATGNFYAVLPGPSPSIEDLHRFRIRGKELRYAMELLARAFPTSFRQSLYPIVSQLQVRLGNLNDHAAAAERLSQMASEHPSKRLKKLIEKEHRAASAAIDDFLNWWTPQQTKAFFGLLHEITHPTQAG